MTASWLLAAFFVPLFPFSAVLVLAVKKIPYAWLRGVIFLVWPQLGMVLLAASDSPLPEWVVYWAVGTSLLYAFRALVVRDLSLWLSYIAVSSWAVLWVILIAGSSGAPLLFALGFSLPIALMALLGGELEKRFDAAYAGLHGGIAQTQPRLSAMLVFTLLAVIATPVFPGFFTMLSSIMVQMLSDPAVAIGLLVVWFLWSWAGILMMQGLVLGPVHAASRELPDLNPGKTGGYSLALVAMVLVGLQFVELF